MILFDARTASRSVICTRVADAPNDLILARLSDDRLVLVTAHEDGITRFDVETHGAAGGLVASWSPSHRQSAAATPQWPT